MMRKVLLLTDGKAGHENQSKALARGLGCDFETARISFSSPLAKAASYLLDRIGVHSLGLYAKSAEGPDPRQLASRRGEFAAVVATGSGCFYAAKGIAERLGVKCAVVLFPRGYRLSDFGCILAPSFDRPPKRPNIVELPANLVPNDADFYAKGVEAFREHYLGSTGRALAEGVRAEAVVIGGPNKCSTMTPEWMKGELDRIFADRKGELWVTTSRRTPADVEKVVDSYPWDYRLLYSRDKFNPIPAFVSIASRIHVTAESTGMLSEACTCGKAEVAVLDNLKPGGHKFRRFVDGLASGGYTGGNRKVDLSLQIARARELLGL